MFVGTGILFSARPTRALRPEAMGARENEGAVPTQRFFLRGIERLQEHHLQDYFAKYGAVTEITVLRDKKTKRPRGMGFIAVAPAQTDEDGDAEERLAAIVEKINEETHTISGVLVEMQEALPRIDDDDEKEKKEPAKGAAPDADSDEEHEAGPGKVPSAPVEEAKPDPKAAALAQAQMQMHYLAMAINASVPDLPTPAPPAKGGKGGQDGKGKGGRSAPYSAAPAGAQPKAALAKPRR